MDTIDCPKCEYEHIPTGSHEDDAGDFTCESCGFEFIVEVEYDPSYSTACKTHSWGEYHAHTLRSGRTETVRFCEHCMRCELKGPSF